MLVCHPFRRFIQRIARLVPRQTQLRTRRRWVPASQLPGEVEIVEARLLLSAVLTDTTPVMTIDAAVGTSTGSVTLATFNDTNAPPGYTTLSATGAVSTSVSGISGSNVAGDFKNSGGVFQGYVYNGSTYSTIDIQGASFTHVAGISGSTAFGTYTGSNGQAVGFVFDGSILTSLVPPNAVSTVVRGVSASTILGTFQDAGGNTHGFTFNGSSYTILDAPGATNTTPTGISGSNIVGSYVDGSGTHSFALNGSTYTTLTPSGAVSSQATAISGNNIVGSYVDGSQKTHGYLYNGSTYTVLDVSGATYTAASAVSGNNIVGSYHDANGATHAFFYDGSTFTSLDVPSATATAAVGVSGTNVAGSYTDSNGKPQSFFYQPPASSSFTATVQWGGTLVGTPTVSVVLASQQPASGSSWKVVGSAIYAATGTYNITVSVSDAANNSLQSSNTSFHVWPSLAGAWLCAGKQTTIQQTGASLTFINENGGKSAGLFTASEQVKATGWGNLVGNLSDNDQKLTWSNGSVWTKVPPVDLAGRWLGNGRPSTITQTGTNLTFINENGGKANGVFLASGQVEAIDWGNLIGTLSDNNTTITWANNSIWTKVPPPDISGTWLANGKTTSIAQSGGNLTITNENGGQTPGFFTPSGQIDATSWGDLIGTLSDNNTTITWSNNSVWTKSSNTTAVDISGSWIANGKTATILESGSNLTFINENGGSSVGIFLASDQVQATGWGKLSGKLTNNNKTLTWANGTVWVHA